MYLDHKSSFVRALDVIRPGITIVHSVTHGVVKQHRDLARSGCDCLRIADPAGEMAVEGPERGVASPDRHRRES